MKKDIFERTKEELKEIIKDYPIDFVIVFGSLIGGNFRDDSDIDIAIHLQRDLDLYYNRLINGFKVLENRFVMEGKNEC